MTEKAKANGNVLDKPTSVWSEMTRKQVEPLITRKANDSQHPLTDASERHYRKEQYVPRPPASIVKPSGIGRRANLLTWNDWP